MDNKDINLPSTVTLTEHVAVLPSESSAWKVSVDSPMGKFDPLNGPPVWVTVGTPVISK